MIGCSDSKNPNHTDDSDAAAMDGDDGGGVDGDSGNGANGGSSGGGSGKSGSSGSGSSGSGASGSGSQDGDAAVGSFVDGGAIAVPEALQLCGGPCPCGDGIDNDSDGVIDGFDTECTGPTDDDEGSFATGISGRQHGPKWQDCFFDGNSGGGDDGCRYSTDCLTGEIAAGRQGLPASRRAASTSARSARRTAATASAAARCTARRHERAHHPERELRRGRPRRVPDVRAVRDCNNDCGECELCAGKTVADLPATCGHDRHRRHRQRRRWRRRHGGMGGEGAGGTGAGGNGGSGGTGDDTGYQCDDGVPLCRSNADRDGSHYCTFGCCVLAGPD